MLLAAMEAGSGQGQSGTPASGPAAGWYPDPEVGGRQRWWDGTRWTEHVHPPQGAPGGFQAQPADPAWLAQRAEADARQWAMFAHLSALLALVTSLPWLGPLIIYLV